MHRLRRVLGLALLTMCTSVPAFAQQTGTVSGVVKDSQGAVLPGATVTASSPALIGGERKVVTGEAGAYQISNLPPGVYALTYELSDFGTVKREEVRVLVNSNTRLDVELSVGALQENVTVSGGSPVVDVASTTTQTNIDRELYESIPTGRNPWVMAGLVPGVVTGRLDVGGTEGMQQYNLEAFGSADSQKSFSIDGLKTNWPGGSGGSTMQYYGFEMYEEYNMQTASGTAESDVSGVYMNMVTKSGGDRFTSDHNLYFMNDSLQADNVDDELRRRLGLAAGAQTGAAGNPIEVSYDWSSTLGGPIIQDKAWFFGALRWWRLDQLQIGAINPDGSQAIDDNRIRNFMGKATYQFDVSTKASFMFNRNLKDRFHRRDAPYLFVEDKATVLQDQPAQNYVAQVNRVVGNAIVVDARFGRMWGVFPTRYQSDVGPDDISIIDSERFTRVNAATEQSLNPNHRYQVNGSVGYFRDNLLGGSHDFKVGFQMSRERMGYDRIRNGDYFLELTSGRPAFVNIGNTPVESDHRFNTWAVFFQDRWQVQRFTINAGVRLDGVHGYIPEQSSPAGNFVGERSFANIDDVPDWRNVAPRLGITYDLLGDGRTAIKGYAGRFFNQIGSEILEGVNPNARIDIRTPWNDLNGNLRLDPGEFTFAGFSRGLFPAFDSDSNRPYSDEYNVGVDHTLMQNLGLSVSYHHRRHRNGLGIVDRARPASAYATLTRTYFDPIAGETRSINVYSLDPALINVRDRIITDVDLLQSDYSGVQFQVTKRMSDRWQLLGGLTLQKHEGFQHGGTYTNTGPQTDLNNPNFVQNRTEARVFTDMPWIFNVSGSYRLPYEILFSAKYTARDGDPQDRTMNISGLAQTEPTGASGFRVAPRGEDRTEVVNKFIDIRFGKQFNFNNTRLEGTLDVFNLFNANHVLLYNEVIGTSSATAFTPATAFLWPTRILTPRIVRFGVTVRF